MLCMQRFKSADTKSAEQEKQKLVTIEVANKQLQVENDRLKYKLEQMAEELERARNLEIRKDEQFQSDFLDASLPLEAIQRENDQDEIQILRDSNRTLSLEVADLQYKLSERMNLLKTGGSYDGDEEREHFHRKMKEHSMQNMRHLAEMREYEDRIRSLRKELEQMRHENNELVGEIEALREIYQLQNTSPKELVSRLKSENTKLEQFLHILEQRMEKNGPGSLQLSLSSGQNSRALSPDAAMFSTSLGSSRPDREDDQADGSLLSSVNHLDLVTGSLDECHQEIQRLRHLNKVSEHISV